MALLQGPCRGSRRQDEGRTHAPPPHRRAHPRHRPGAALAVRRDSSLKRREAGPDPTGTRLALLSLLHEAGGGRPVTFGCDPPIWWCDVFSPTGEAGGETASVPRGGGGSSRCPCAPRGDDAHRQPAVQANANSIISLSLPWPTTVLPKCLKNARPHSAVALKSKLNLNLLCCAHRARRLWGHPVTIPGEGGNYHF